MSHEILLKVMSGKAKNLAIGGKDMNKDRVQGKQIQAPYRKTKMCKFF
jgi:hypothetical protein